MVWIISKSLCIEYFKKKHNLEFIKKLKPVDYKFNYRSDYITYEQSSTNLLNIIKKIEDLLKEERLKFLEQELKRPYTPEELNAMIDNAEKDAAEGKVMSTAQLKQQISTWK